MTSVKQYYDDFVDTQIDFGVNQRHICILQWTKKLGLLPDSKILEIGCGIGTQTELIAKYLRKGNITAIDISPQSINVAKERLKNYKNVKLLVADITKGFETRELFDVILLPDVLEHIPIDHHQSLFANLKRILKENGTAIIHIPDPYYLKWLREKQPETLQLIDQSIYANELANIIYPSGFYFSYIESYCIWTTQPDYQIIALKHAPHGEYTFKKGKKFFSRLMNKIGF